MANRASVEAAAHVTAVTISDTGAAIAAALATLNADTEIGSIVIADNAAITVTSAQKTADAHALAELIKRQWNRRRGHGRDRRRRQHGRHRLGGDAFRRTRQPQRQHGLDLGGDQRQRRPHLQRQPGAERHPPAGRAEGSERPGLCPEHQGHGRPVAAHLDALNGAAHIGAITLTDTNRLTLTAAQVATDAIALSKVSGAWSLTVSDTAANLTSALSTLKSNSHLAALTITDSGPITLTNAQYNADFAVLAKIGGAHVIDVTGLTGLGYTSEIFAYNSSGTLTTETFQSANAVTVYGLSANQTFASPTVAETIWALAGGDTFVIAPGAASETINGFNLASDVLSFSHTLFTTPASVLADAASDGHGGVLIHQGALKIDLAGVSLAQLQQHSSDFHFY